MAFILTFSLTSCISITPVVSFVDYSQYSANGMFLTESNSVNFLYEPVGSINVLLYSGYTVDNKQEASEVKKEKGDDIYYSPNPVATRFKGSTIQEALRLVVEQAKDRGANAIINLKCEYVPGYKYTPPGWHVSGMAIKK
jgi:hypothetical protein